MGSAEQISKSPCHRTNIHNFPALLLFHVLNRCLSAKKGALEIDVMTKSQWSSVTSPNLAGVPKDPPALFTKISILPRVFTHLSIIPLTCAGYRHPHYRYGSSTHLFYLFHHIIHRLTSISLTTKSQPALARARAMVLPIPFPALLQSDLSLNLIINLPINLPHFLWMNQDLRTDLSVGIAC